MAQFEALTDYEFPFQVGIMNDGAAAQRFSDFLTEKGIKNKVKHQPPNLYVIYVAEAKEVSFAKRAIMDFRANPYGKQYTQASWNLGSKAKLKTFNRSAARGRSGWQLKSVTSLVELLCVLATVWMMFAPDGALQLLAWWQLDQVFGGGELWRLVTPCFIHFGVLHILFNLVMFEAFARPIERYLGGVHLLLVVLCIGVVDNLLAQLVIANMSGVRLVGGLSGVVYGVIGYAYIMSKHPDLAMMSFPRGMFMVCAVIIGISFVLSFMGLYSSPVSEIVHAGGLILGVLIALGNSKRKLKIRY